MKSSFLFGFLIFLTINLFAGAFLSYFHVRSEEDNIILNWQTSQEINLKEYKIERRSSTGPFVEIGSVKATGDNSIYTFTDENAFKTSDALYVYRLKLVDQDATSTYSIEVAVSHNPTTVKRTWGSIKALFR
jgi:hypothetical protein